MNEGYCDLHTHSTFSDGTDTPIELIAAAERCGLRALALTDHNTIGGVAELFRAAEGSTVEAVAGVEISAAYGERELHILGLCIPEDALFKVDAFLAPFRLAKEKSSRDLVAALTEAGYRLDYDVIAKETEGIPNRAHIAAALTSAGYFPSTAATFESVLAKGGGFYHEPPRPAADETITLLHSIGALAVLAHPFYDFKEQELRAFLDALGARGIRFDALETKYAEYTKDEEVSADRVAAAYRLLPAGGSDYHGKNKPHISLGTGRGGLAVPISYLEDLKKLQEKGR